MQHVDQGIALVASCDVVGMLLFHDSISSLRHHAVAHNEASLDAVRLVISPDPTAA
jgi:hypothetical protein